MSVEGCAGAAFEEIDDLVIFECASCGIIVRDRVLVDAECDQASEKSAKDLRENVDAGFAHGETAVYAECEGDGGVKMSSRYSTGYVDSNCDS